jgi:hypothetical protein
MAGRSLCATLLAIAVALVVAATSGAAPKTLFVSPAGSDAGNDCTSRDHPCQSFDAAYQAAANGDHVEVAGGTYPGQSITHDASKQSGANVVFAPATGAVVTMSGQLSVNASFVTVRDFRGQDFEVSPPDVGDPPPVSHVTLEGIDGRNFNVFSATDVTVQGGDWGPASDCGGAFGGSNNSIRNLSGVNPARIVIDGVTIHDVQSEDLVQCHIEGLAIFAGDGVTVRNSKFYGNSIYDIFLQENSGPISGLTLENNWFAQPVGTDGRRNGSALGFSDVSSGVTIRNNSLNGVASLDDNGDKPQYTDFVVTGNIGDLGFDACKLSGIEWSYNVWQTDKCGATDVNLNGGAFPYVSRENTAALDYHLTGGVAQDLIPGGASTLERDIDGDARPQGAGTDAGSDEIVVGGPTPTPTATSTPTATPTTSPTSTPTSSPTSTPTSSPTSTPTSSPTSTPTSSPTSTPTSSPTSIPTATPTETPTASPSSTAAPAPGSPAPAPIASPPPATLAPSPTLTLHFSPVADAALLRASPRRRGGAAKLLPVSRAGDALLAFRIAGVGSGTVERARLRLWVARGRAGKLTVRRTNAGWKERRASWRTAPKAKGKPVGSVRRLRAHRFVTVDVTGAVTGDGRLSLRLSSPSRKGLTIASRAGERHAPRLDLSVSKP